MDLGIKNKTAVITGGSQGLGLSIAKNFLKEGVKVIICSRSILKINKLKKIFSNKNVKFVKSDLKLKKGRFKLMKFLHSNKIQPDILINNLGGDLNFKETLINYDKFEKVFNLNFGTAIELNKLFVPIMKKKKWGRICHISSISGVENHGTPAYCSAKSALNAYVRSVGRALISKDVIMTGILPGAFESEGGYWEKIKKKNFRHYNKFKNQRLASKKFGNTNNISKVAVFLCSKYVDFCAGSSLLIDGGQGRSFQL